MNPIGYTLIIAQIVCVLFGKAQNTYTQKKRHKVGFITGYGGQEGIKVGYTYKVYFLQAQYAYTVWQKHHWKLEIVTQPQYNITHYRPINGNPKEMNGYELGINVGCVIAREFLHGHMGIYLLPSIGPHYIDGAPKSQTSGFIFSNNLFMGLYIKIAKSLYLDIRSGFRHISNANLKKPNGGINTVIWSGGVFFMIP